ncbi:hypothetical protein PoB_004123400 [Plakobranchus ocellatus]|uniref:Uncharacterized protein n=1 Tax=Plakobranchus ocellatus TaxID=259542 RepID=A0AAV4B8R4_9GAST|nr:hypothetical protein PoB_004123400 [Plakobranchus ocellatus]
MVETLRGRTKPAAIHTYNQYMNGCDKADQNIYWLQIKSVCTVDIDSHCSTPAARKRTGFICGDCSDKPHLHPKECFAAYHKHI